MTHFQKTVKRNPNPIFVYLFLPISLQYDSVMTKPLNMCRHFLFSVFYDFSANLCLCAVQLLLEIQLWSHHDAIIHSSLLEKQWSQDSYAFRPFIITRALLQNALE